jgi:two-component system, chemotaxis family, protein-glutamate methylesterase/glutaminase
MIRVMVVDDSPLVRRIATDILSAEPDITVVATAANAEFALGKLDRERPDVITLDLEMPGMGGLEAIRRIMAQRATPIVVLSAHARRGAELTLQALEAGAVEFVLKPESSLSGGLPAVARELVDRVREAARSTVHARPLAVPEAALPAPVTPPAPAFAAPLADGAGFDIVAIGTSTGGPVALKEVLAALPADFPVPVVVVQHMPPVFTKAFADRLNSVCAVRVKEAADGDPLLPGTVLVAPGAFHLTVSRAGGAARAAVETGEPVSGHRPSVDVLIRSVAGAYGARALGVIMTGMGRDGADAFRELHRRGGRVLAQDQESSVIFGMNREVIQNGDADEVLPLERIGSRLDTLARGGIPARRTT